jgi:hypothetical protein
MLSSRKPKSKSPRTPKLPRSPKSPVFIDIGSGSLNTSPASPTRKASPKTARSPARWATAVKQASPKASPQAARRTSPPPLTPPPSWETTVGVNAPLYSVRSPAAMLSAHANAHAATTETEYPSKFIAIYYIDMMQAFIDDFAVCCIGMLSGIDNVKYIMAHPHFKEGVINKLIRFKDNIKPDRYIYKQGNIEAEIRYIEFFLREKVIQSYTSLETSSYFMGLRYIWDSLGHPKKGKERAIKQHAHISTILKNPQYSDEKKLEEIQEYTTRENKALVVMVNETTRLNKMSLASVDDKLKFITKKIDELGKIINLDFFTDAGKINYNDYLQIIRRQGTQGGKRAKAAKQRSVIAKRGGVGSRFRRLFGMKDKGYKVIPMNEDVSQDYMAVLNIYKDGHIDKLRQLYDIIASIFNYAEYHREYHLKMYKQNKEEYGYLLKDVKGFKKINYRVDEKQRLAILDSLPDLIETSHFVHHILHNFEILAGRKVELERKITLYYA